MSKLVKILGIAAVVTIVGAMLVGAVAFAQEPEGAPFGRGTGFDQGAGFGQGPGFIDEDGDGVCDHYGTRPNFVDEDGDGVCDTCGAGQRMGRGRGFNQ